ncbi:hypothetical protein H0V99_02265 [Candidatus Saccharibacteria bacterium]|nr:hypothetical protein [Candidatus Saccharibacteria bacterium]
MGRSGILASIFLRPLSKLGKPSQPDIKVTFTFHPIVCKAEYWCRKESMLGDEWMITTFAYYLGRYLSICDDRQREMMAELLSELFNVKDEKDMHILAELCYENLLPTLTDDERKAAAGLFGMFPPVRLYYQNRNMEVPDEKFSTYIYQMVMTSKGMQTHLELGVADMILFPLSVVHLYTFVSGEASTKNSRLLSELSNEILLDYYNNDQPLSWMHAGINKMLKKYPQIVEKLKK